MGLITISCVFDCHYRIGHEARRRQFSLCSGHLIIFYFICVCLPVSLFTPVQWMNLVYVWACDFVSVCACICTFLVQGCFLWKYFSVKWSVHFILFTIVRIGRLYFVKYKSMKTLSENIGFTFTISIKAIPSLCLFKIRKTQSVEMHYNLWFMYFFFITLVVTIKDFIYSAVMLWWSINTKGQHASLPSVGVFSSLIATGKIRHCVWSYFMEKSIYKGGLTPSVLREQHIGKQNNYDQR